MIPELDAWWSASPVIVAAIGWCVLPGLLVTVVWGLRGVTAWGLAPVVSIGSVAVGAVAAERLAIPWSPPAALAPALILALLAVVVRAASYVLRRPARAGGSDGEDPDRRGRRTGDGWAVAVAALVGSAVAAGLGLVTMALGAGPPSAISQTYDAVFHYDAIARILATGDASSLTLGTLTNPAASSAFYPAAWHGMVSIVVLTSGASIPVATSVTAAVIAAVVWPLACTALVRTIAGPSWSAIAFAPVAAVGFIAFPWTLLGYGVLWPNLIGLSVVPAGLAAVLALCGLAANSSLTAARAAVFLPVVVVTLGLAHPSSLISFAVLALPPAAWWFGRVLLRLSRTGARVLPGAMLLAVLALAGAASWFLLTSPLFADVRAFDWPAYQSPPQAVGEVVLGATNGKEAAWAISAVVLAGMVAAWRVPEQRWLLPAHLASGTLFVLASSLESPLSAAVTGFWYNDSYRLAAMLPVTGVPLVVLGVTAIGTAVHARWPRPGVPLIATVAAAALVLASNGMYVRDHADSLRTAYPDPPPTRGGLLSDDERAFFERIGPQIPPGAVVAQNPWSGSSLLWPLTGREVLFPHLTGEWTDDQLLLAQGLRDAGSDPRVCPVAERLNVRYLLVGIADFWLGDQRANGFPGLVAPPTGPDFRLVSADGRGNILYEMTACGDLEEVESG